MLELPPALTKNFGLGPRSFSSSTGPKPQQDKSWTRAPTDSVLATAGNDDNEPQKDDQVWICLNYSSWTCKYKETYHQSMYRGKKALVFLSLLM